MSFWGLVFKIFAWLAPPEELDWNLRIYLMKHFLLNMAIAAGAVVYVLCANGTVPWSNGFAYAGEMQKVLRMAQEIQETQRENRIDTIKMRIIQLRAQQCLAIQQDNPTQFITTRLRNWTDEYHRLTGSRYNMPACKEVRE